MKLFSNRKYWLSTVGWMIRTCLSATLIVVLCLNEKTKYIFSYHGTHLSGLAIASLVCVVVKDSTLGASIHLAWAATMGTFIATFPSWIILLLLGGGHNPMYNLVIMFVLAFIIQYIEFHSIGKKLALGLVALNFLRNPGQEPNLTDIWLFLFDVMFGCACGIIGNILPWPRTAYAEMEEVVQFNAVNIGSLLETMIQEWFHIDRKNNDHHNHSNINSNSNSNSQIKTNTDFTRYVRQELITRLYKNLSHMQMMTMEAKLDPRRDHTDTYVRFIALTRQLLVIIDALEKRLKNMENMDKFHFILHEFFRFRLFHIHLQSVSSKLSAALFEITQWLLQPTLKPTVEVTTAMSELQVALRRFEDTYSEARAIIYYNGSSSSHSMIQCERDSSSKEGLEADNDNNDNDNVIISPSIVESRRKDTNINIDTNADTNKALVTIPIPIPMEPSLLMEMNSFLFLIDIACTLVLDFEPSLLDTPVIEVYNPNGRETLDTHSQSLSQSQSQYSIYSSLCYFVSEISLRIRHFLRHMMRIRADLIPPQRHLFQFPWSCSTPLSPAIKRRMRQAFSVSASMFLGALYSYFAGQTNPYFAAFTVAFVSGGAISGANIMTSFNRCIGTITACTLALLVARIIIGWDITSAKWFVGTVLVLAQIPATYTRTQPKYGYAGLCFGFTMPYLLINFTSFTTDVAVERIIDTIVGVFIFISMEIIMLQFDFAEDILLDDTSNVFKGIESHFEMFIKLFNSTTVGSQQVLSQSVRDNQAKETVKLAPTFFVQINRQKSLLPYLSIEPSLWGLGSFPKEMLMDLIRFEEEAHKAIEIMAWAAIASHNYTPLQHINHGNGDNGDSGDIELGHGHGHPHDAYDPSSSFTSLLGALEPQIIEVEDLVCRASAMLRGRLDRLRDETNVTATDIGQAGSSKELFMAVTASPFAETDITEALSVAIADDSVLLRHLGAVAENLRSSYRAKMNRLDEYENENISSSSSSHGGERSELPFKIKCEQSIISNAEVKIVHAALVCLRDLLGALIGMTSVLMKMQAYRSVEASENRQLSVLHKDIRTMKSSKEQGSNLHRSTAFYKRMWTRR
eukprot:gene249-458_t